MFWRDEGGYLRPARRRRESDGVGTACLRFRSQGSAFQPLASPRRPEGGERHGGSTRATAGGVGKRTRFRMDGREEFAAKFDGSRENGVVLAGAAAHHLKEAVDLLNQGVEQVAFVVGEKIEMATERVGDRTLVGAREGSDGLQEPVVWLL